MSGKPLPFRRESTLWPPLMTAGFDEAVSRALYVVEGGRSGALIIGPAGSGKSLLLDYVRRQVSSVTCRWMNFRTGFATPSDFLHEICRLFGWNAEMSERAIWTSLADELSGLGALRGQLVVSLDEADSMAAETFGIVQRLLTIANESGVATSLMGAVRPEERCAVLEDLVDLVSLRIDMVPWDADDCSRWLLQRSQTEGRTATFSPAAIDRLRAWSENWPGEFIRLCELTWMAAEGCETTHIDVDLVDSVTSELMPSCSHPLFGPAPTRRSA